MKHFHGYFEFEVDDDWWFEAGMVGFVPLKRMYRVISDTQKVLAVPTADIQPVRRNLTAGIFNDDPEKGLSAKERVLSILRAFRDDKPLPPIELVECLAWGSHRYKLTHGAHRLYLSLAAGFTHVPSVTGFDWAKLDQ